MGGTLESNQEKGEEAMVQKKQEKKDLDTSLKESKKDPLPSKEKKAPKPSPKSQALPQEIADFRLEIHEVKTALPNPVWFIPSDKPIVVVSIVFKDAGRKNLNATYPGLDAFIAPMLIRGAGSYDHYTMMEKLVDNGASLDFHVGSDDSVGTLWAPAPSYKEPLQLAVLALTQPKLPSRFFEKIRKESLLGLEESLKIPETHLYEGLQKHFYPEGHPYRCSLEQIREGLKHAKVKDIRHYLKYLSQENLLIVVLGPRDKEKEIVQDIEKEFLKIPKTGIQPVQGDKPILQPKEDLHIEFDVPQTLIASEQRGFGRKDPHFFAKKLAVAVVAGHSLHSMLYREIRTKHGLAYSCGGSNIENSLCSTLYFFVGTQTEKAEESKKFLKELLRKVQKEGISKADFETAKKMFLGSFVVDRDSSTSIAHYVGTMRGFGYTLPEIQDYLQNYKKLPYEDVNKASKEVFNPDTLCFVTVGQKNAKKHI
ncbi:hypothetical protein AGMMS49949_06940 [Alphaproteobacteria bacterium]|nr:hypothetical protein AGMMS49949_06940 [Alphaproteobacteria bacterium]GHS98621.1 hypothetical protein AGMMS50296_6390 [Alphaproteobacteria bacterium]